MSVWIALLRGINLGKRTVKMDQLKSAFEKMGFASVQTLLASGNVIFSASAEPESEEIETALQAEFGFPIGTVLRSLAQIEALRDLNAFANFPKDSDTNHYATFAKQKIGDQLHEFTSIKGDFEIVHRDDFHILTVGFRQKDGRFGPGRTALVKPRKNLLLTDRNWNTVEKMAIKAQALKKD